MCLASLPLCGSRKNPYPPHGRSLEIPRGRGGVSKAKFLEEMYESKLVFPGGGGGGCKTKNPLWGEYAYFVELHIYLCSFIFSNLILAFSSSLIAFLRIFKTNK